MILPLPAQIENETKEWIFCQLNIATTMNNIVHKTNISIDNNICNERKRSIIQIQTSMVQKLI